MGDATDGFGIGQEDYVVRNNMVRGNDTPQKCPACKEPYNAVIGPRSKLRHPDRGEWCFANGCIYVHETLEWDND